VGPVPGTALWKRPTPALPEDGEGEENVPYPIAGRLSLRFSQPSGSFVSGRFARLAAQKVIWFAFGWSGAFENIGCMMAALPRTLRVVMQAPVRSYR